MGVLIKDRSVTASSSYPISAYRFDKDDACIAIKNVREIRTTTSGVYSLRITFDTEFASASCLTASTVTFVATDNTGCQQSALITYEDVCNGLTIGTISHEGNYRFSVAPSGGEGGYSYTWNYDSTLFTATSATNLSYIQLNYIGSQPQPLTTTIRCTVKTTNRCEDFTEYSHFFCRPVVYYTETSTSCLPSTEILGGGTINRKSYAVTLSAGLCVGTTLDMSTFSPDIPTGMYYSVVGSQVYFGAASTVVAGNKQINYIIKDSDGNAASGTIGVVVNACPVANTISIPNNTFFVGCDLEVDDVFQIPIEPNIVIASGTTVDWDSFAVTIAPESGTTVALNNDTYGNHYVDYTIPADVTSESFSIELCDTDGNCSNLGIITVVNACQENPVLVNKTPTCNCAGSVTTDVTAGGTINAPGWNYDSLVITQTPTYGTVSVGSGGNITYTAPVGYNGNAIYKYKISNTNGKQSNEATATVTVSCAGIGTTITVCDAA